jgi:hypothetical protein
LLALKLRLSAIIEKYRLNYEIEVSEITLDMAANMD